MSSCQTKDKTSTINDVFWGLLVWEDTGWRHFMVIGIGQYEIGMHRIEAT